MADDTEVEGDKPTKKSKGKGVLVALVLSLLLGGGGFYAVYSGLLLGSDSSDDMAEAHPDSEMKALPDVAYVPLQPLVINIGAPGEDRFLRFQAQLEVEPDAVEDVSAVLPRVIDVLNGYLRAVDMADLESRAALVKLRGQMLRRVQVVTGQGRIRDLLIMEFVLS